MGILEKLAKNWHYFVGYKGLFIFHYVLKFIAIVLNLVGPIFLANVITSILSASLTTLISNLIILFSIDIVSLILGQVASRIELKIKTNVYNNVKLDLLKKFFEIPPYQLREYNSGKLFNMILNDSSQIPNYTFLIINSIFNIISILGIGVVIFILSWRLSLIILATYPLLYLINWSYGKKIKLKTQKLYKDSDEYLSFYKCMLTSADEIKANNGSIRMYEIFREKTRFIKDETMNTEKIKLNNALTCGAVGLLNNFLFLFMSLFLVFIKQVTFGNFIAFYKYSSSFTNALTAIISLNASLQPSLVILNRIEDFENLYKKNNNKETKKSNNAEGEIRFNNVGLVLGDKVIFNNLDLIIKPNKVNGIFGYNGSGKTSILNLIVEKYKCNNGNIYLDGINIDNLSYKFLQDNIVYIRQNPSLFNVTLEENLLMFDGADRVSKEQLEYACKAINFLDDIKKMPNGFASEVGEDNKLSVGQTQKMQIARAILMNRPIILIDEATVNLDNITKEHFYNVIKKNWKGKTIVFISNSSDENVICDNITKL